MKHTYFFLYSPFRCTLYKSLASKYIQHGYDVVFIVQDLESYFRIKSNFKTILLKTSKRGNNDNDNDNDNDIVNSIDVISGHFNLKEARKLANSFITLLDRLEINNDDIVFAGNGYHLQDIIIKNYQSKHKFTTFFSELSNIDDRTFFDIKGANAKSLFFNIAQDFFFKKSTHLPEINKDPNFNIDEWKKKYIEKKYKNHIVPQAKTKKIASMIRWRILNFIELILNIPSFSVVRFKSSKKTLFSKREKLKIPYENKKINDYYFFPLQVTDDSQIKINSHTNNIDALLYYLKKAKINNKNFVVKIHPAEKNINFIKKIVSLSISKEFSLSNLNTFQLIKNADIICTINSTVGFEAILLGKNVKFLGQSFYKFFEKNEILNFYISQYLIKINFFTGEIFENNIVEKLYSLSKLNHD